MEQSAREGVIVKGVGGLYYARQPDGEVHVLRAKGKFRKQHKTPMVGDRILFTPASGDEHGWVEEILPRTSELIRPPVANIHTVLLVLAPQPEPDYLLIDTLLVMTARQNIRPVLVANKCDLSSEVYESLVREYSTLQIPILRVSAEAGEGLDELRAVLDTVQPEYFVPVHGEYRHLALHARLAEECGVQSDNILILEDGQPITLTADGCRRDPSVPVESVLVDGKGVGDVGRLVLKERRILGGEGLVVVVLVIAEETGEVLHGPEMISRGFVFEQQYSHLLEDAKCLVLDHLETMSPYDLPKLQDRIRSSLRRFFRDVLDRVPIVVPIVTAV